MSRLTEEEKRAIEEKALRLWERTYSFNAARIQFTPGLEQAHAERYLWGLQAQVQRIMEDLFTEIHTLLFAGDYAGADKCLEQFDPRGYAPIVGVGMLRASFAARQQLPSWQPLLGKVRCWLNDNDANPRLLRGLE
jgi:hypothetical protein